MTPVIVRFCGWVHKKEWIDQQKSAEWHYSEGKGLFWDKTITSVCLDHRNHPFKFGSERFSDWQERTCRPSWRDHNGVFFYLHKCKYMKMRDNLLRSQINDGLTWELVCTMRFWGWAHKKKDLASKKKKAKAEIVPLSNRTIDIVVHVIRRRTALGQL